MRSIRVEVRHGLPWLHGKPVYRRNDYGLIYETSLLPSERVNESLSETIGRHFGMRTQNVFVMVDTLTLVFNEPGRRLVSLDAYTNEERWQHAAKGRRPNGPRGALVLNERVEDRISLDVVPSYQFDAVDSTLSIVFGGDVAQYFEVGDDLFVGLSDGNLAEVVMTNLRIE